MNRSGIFYLSLARGIIQYQECITESTLTILAENAKKIVQNTIIKKKKSCLII